MFYRLISPDGTLSCDLKLHAPLIVGRAPTCDLSVADPTISRRHAELVVDEDQVTLRDLGSSNGTFVNGHKVAAATLEVDDLIAFGKVAFRLATYVPTPSVSSVAVPAAAGVGGGGGAVGPTIVRELSLRNRQTPFTSLNAPSTAPGGVARVPSPLSAPPSDKSQERLATLLEVAKGLTRAVDVDAILGKIVAYAYQTLDVDRVAVLLLDERGELVQKIARDKRGADAPRSVPQSIARKAVEEKVALLSDDAVRDDRFTGDSIVMQQVRSAICAPLIGGEDRVLGVLYVDTPSATHRFTEEDLEFVVAFAGIAGVAIENSEFSERIRREALVRSNFERYFAPQLAERIANAPEAIKLGGAKRRVAVLFSDIRGFTQLSESMTPDETASLLTEYFTEMVECVFRHGGTLDKFMGDAVMAQWGAPIGMPDDADQAMSAALDMRAAMETLTRRWQAEGRPRLELGIGLNYGEAFAGNIGSERRLEYTVIGDTVNTANRLCSAADSGQILITEEMRRALKSPPPLAVCPPVELKGKSQPLPVYRVEG
jgi:adenylate cyclase